MADIVEKFGQIVNKEIPKNPDTARKELLFAYKAFNVKLKHAPDKRLPKSRQYMSTVCMNEHIKSFSNVGDSAMVSIFLPCEVLRAMDISTVFAEGFSAYITGAYAERPMIEAAEAAGIAETYCSYHKILMGAAFSKVLPKPKFIINTSIVCDANNLTFRALADYYDVPQFYIDVPTDTEEDSVKYVTDQLREMTKFIEKNTGRKLDEDKLKACVARTRDSIANFKKCMELKKDKYLPGDITSEMYEVFLTHTLFGTEETLKYSEMLLEDLKNAEPKKGIRLLWMHTIPYFQAPLRERLNFSEKCQIITCDTNFENFVDIDPEKPYESMARKMVLSSYNGPSENRINKAAEVAKYLDVDGVIYFCHWGCKQTMGAAVNAKKKLEEAGFPTLVLNGDGGDRRNTSDGQVLTRLDAFIEMLEDMKK
ncbi:MAG: 2-hydroxyacyl-CoA dehydratase family protein [Clostridiales bacterium]|nr:2-hydroxyacyl-CoA dehydratase family protein [Clostridiales bacterium]